MTILILQGRVCSHCQHTELSTDEVVSDLDDNSASRLGVAISMQTD